jgi:CSLREA domain-containing protein
MKHNGFALRLSEGLHLSVTLALLIGLALALTPMGTVHAAGFTVNTTADTDDANPGNGVCADGSGNCSLRAAISEANALAGADTITLPAGTYTLAVGGTGEDANATGDLDITDDLTINGVDQDTTIIDAAQIDRVLQITDTVTVVINEVTIRNGETLAGVAGSGDDGEDGGGIHNTGNLSLSRCSVISNGTGGGGQGAPEANTKGGPGGRGGHGGGIYSSGSLTLTNSSVMENTTGAGGKGGSGSAAIGGDYNGNGGPGGSGGGVYNSGNLRLIGSHVMSNTTGVGGVSEDGTFSGSGGGGGHGGGICSTSGAARLIDSAVGDNATGSGSGGSGGGIRSSGDLTLYRTTVERNTTGDGPDGPDGSTTGGAGGSGGAGGGLSIVTGTVVLTNTTISGNTTGSGGDGGDGPLNSGGAGGNGGDGGGICTAGGAVDLTNTTVSANTTGPGGSGGSGPPNGASGTDGRGGGIRASAGTTSLKNTIVAGNSAAGSGHDCHGSVDSHDYNLIQVVSGCTLGGTNTNNVTGEDARLGVLALYPPGNTDTHALLLGELGNPGVDHIPFGINGCGTSLAEDQRGRIRPQGRGCDIGAYELGFGTVVLRKRLEPGGPAFTIIHAAVLAGSHTFSETSPGPDYELTALECVEDGMNNSTADAGTGLATANVEAGETVTCTFTNSARSGTITVRKQTDPAGGTGFSFAHNVDGGGGFDLDDDGSEPFLDVPPGTYTVIESDPTPADFELTSLVCLDGSVSNSTTNAGGRQATIRLDPGEHVTCTFTNTQQAHIVIDKVTLPAGDTTRFYFELTGGPSSLNQSFSLTDATAPHDSGPVQPGSSYSASESVPGGWELTGSTCSDGSPIGNIDLSPGETVTCTFTDTLQTGSIEVCKEVVPYDASLWDVALAGPTPGTYDDLGDGGCHTFDELLPGTYTLSETPEADYTTAVDCGAKGSDDDSDISFSLDPADHVTCTFTNARRAKLVIEKRARVAGATSVLTFEIPSLVPGAYPVIELSSTPGVTLTGITCNDGDSPTPSTWDLVMGMATFELDPGEAVTCVFSNLLPFAVGGAAVPAEPLDLLAPWLGLAALVSLGAVAVATVRRRGD